MKQTLQIVLSIVVYLFISNAYAQKKYKFDKIVNYSFSTSLHPNQKKIHLFNLENDTYHMQLFNQNDSLKATIIDTKVAQVHYFHVDQADSLKLKFIKTKPWERDAKDYTFEFSDIKEKKEAKEMVFKIYNTKKKRIARYKLKIKETEKSQFSIFKRSALETLLFTSITPSSNFLVLEAKGTNTHGRYVEYQLDTIKDINLSVEIPN